MDNIYIYIYNIIYIEEISLTKPKYETTDLNLLLEETERPPPIRSQNPHNTNEPSLEEIRERDMIYPDEELTDPSDGHNLHTITEEGTMNTGTGTIIGGGTRSTLKLTAMRPTQELGGVMEDLQGEKGSINEEFNSSNLSLIDKHTQEESSFISQSPLDPHPPHKASVQEEESRDFYLGGVPAHFPTDNMHPLEEFKDLFYTNPPNFSPQFTVPATDIDIDIYQGENAINNNTTLTTQEKKKSRPPKTFDVFKYAGDKQREMAITAIEHKRGADLHDRPLTQGVQDVPGLVLQYEEKRNNIKNLKLTNLRDARKNKDNKETYILVYHIYIYIEQLR